VEGLLCRHDGRVRHQREVDAGVGDEVVLEPILRISSGRNLQFKLRKCHFFKCRF
jgi:hypothetical protein